MILWIQIRLIPNHGELDGHGKSQTTERPMVTANVQLFELPYTYLN